MNVIKVASQSTMGGPHINIVSIFQNIYYERDCKIYNLYKGCSINFTRAFIGWGLVNASYEMLKNIIY